MDVLLIRQLYLKNRFFLLFTLLFQYLCFSFFYITAFGNPVRFNSSNHYSHTEFYANHVLTILPDLIKPPDHLDAVKLERDGHLNKDFRKEVLLGNNKDNVETFALKQKELLLTDIFRRVDVNNDEFISLSELEDWIIEKVHEHLDEAIEENQKIFDTIDKNHNGVVSWDEYHVHFLVKSGLDKNYAENHVENHENLEPRVQDTIVQDKSRWSEADENPDDGGLVVQEFLTFRHPEQSKTMLEGMAREILRALDKNADDELTVEEFAALPPGAVDDEWKLSDERFQKDRMQEFKDIIDLNKDGRVNHKELLAYLDPRNTFHAKNEAKTLIEMADANGDSQLSLREVLDNRDLFLGSKMVDTGRSFHDEF